MSTSSAFLAPTTVGALVTNPNESLAAYGVTVVFNLLDADGNAIDTDSTEVAYLPAGATVPVTPLSIGYDTPTEPAEMRPSTSSGDFAEHRLGRRRPLMGEGVDLDVTPPPSDPCIPLG
ncbi:MAG: FxLYD domain-containing protein [Microthrixaceae bacterium]